MLAKGDCEGKTHGLPLTLLMEAQDATYTRGSGHFGAFAFRTLDQAREKAEELRSDQVRTFLFMSFTQHYKDACTLLDVDPIRSEIGDEDQWELFKSIKLKQPEVFCELEQVRKRLWAYSHSPNAKLDLPSHSTILIMSHAMVEVWDESIFTRAWHNPKFSPNIDVDQLFELKEKVQLTSLALDDPETSTFYALYRADDFEWICKRKSEINWTDLEAFERREKYCEVASNRTIPKVFGGFSEFDHGMRLNTDLFQPLAVDFSAAPFGHGGPTNEYAKRNGREYYIATKPWWVISKAHITVLTTETLVFEAARRTIDMHTEKERSAWKEKRSGAVSRPSLRLVALQLDNKNALSLKIPVIFDPRARNDPKKDNINVLAKEILCKNEHAVIIGNGATELRKNERVMTFQRMKGVNSLKENDIFIVVTYLEMNNVYCELNVVGQWLDLPDVIAHFYGDQINQAVGRNRGYRQSNDHRTKTVVIMSRELWNELLFQYSEATTRLHLYVDKEFDFSPYPDRDLEATEPLTEHV